MFWEKRHASVAVFFIQRTQVTIKLALHFPVPLSITK